ncbi:MAG: hypothetical protein KF715_03570 [Candidatus Didemnitutus sp.]|nr:hypothetical protein [Candidatus Didemnitutus sp.]
MPEHHSDLPDKAWVRFGWCFLIGAIVGFLVGMLNSTDTRLISAIREGLYFVLPVACLCGAIGAWGKRCMSFVLDFILSV